MNIGNGLFRKRDVIIILIVTISIYLSLFDTPSLHYTIEPAWYVDQRQNKNSDPTLVRIEGQQIVKLNPIMAIKY
jgi:hypothetical protein